MSGEVNRPPLSEISKNEAIKIVIDDLVGSLETHKLTFDEHPEPHLRQKEPDLDDLSKIAQRLKSVQTWNEVPIDVLFTEVKL